MNFKILISLSFNQRVTKFFCLSKKRIMKMFITGSLIGIGLKQLKTGKKQKKKY